MRTKYGVINTEMLLRHSGKQRGWPSWAPARANPAVESSLAPGCKPKAETDRPPRKGKVGGLEQAANKNVKLQATPVARAAARECQLSGMKQSSN